MATKPDGLCVECPRFEECLTKGELRTNAGKLAYRLGELLLADGVCAGPVYDSFTKEVMGIDPRCANPNFNDAIGIMRTIQINEWRKRISQT